MIFKNAPTLKQYRLASRLKDEKLIKKQTYTKTEAC